MRILLYTTSYPPKVSGVATFVGSLARFATRAGHEVLVLTSSATKTQIEAKEQADHGVRVVTLPSLPNPFHRTLTVPVAFRRTLATIVDSFRPDVIHLNDPLPTAMVLADLARRRAIPTIATQHFSVELLAAYVPRWLEPLLGRGISWWLRRAYRSCQLITCPSKKTASDLQRWGIRVPIRVMSNGVELERFASPTPTNELRERFGLPTTEPLLLFVGRLDRDKSIDILIRSLVVARRIRQARLVIVGDGDERHQLEALARQLGIGDAVTFTGRIQHDDPALPGLFQLADLFVIASTIETQGIVVIEAMAAGLPVVAVNANALPELVIDGTTGRVVPPADPAAFAAAVTDLVNNPPTRRAMSRAARVAARPHDLDRCLGEFLLLYERLLGMNLGRGISSHE